MEQPVIRFWDSFFLFWCVLFYTLAIIAGVCVVRVFVRVGVTA